MPGLLTNQLIAPSLGLWADGPIALVKTPKFETKATDQFTEVASQMAMVHNSIIRGWNSIYLQAPNVVPHDFKDFVGYAYAWYELLDAHHRGEEEFAFPALEKMTGVKGIMDANIQQ